MLPPMRHAGPTRGIGVAAVTLPLDSGAGKIRKASASLQPQPVWTAWPLHAFGTHRPDRVVSEYEQRQVLRPQGEPLLLTPFRTC